MATTTFPFFPFFPAELRYEIWDHALQEFEPTRPVLHFFRRRGCWVPQPLTESDPGYIAGRKQLGMYFRTDLLEPDNQLVVPLVYVNREARRVALAWFRKQGIEIRPQPDGRALLVRPFRPELDALYASWQKFFEFYYEPVDRLCEPDLRGQSVHLHSAVGRIAVPEAVFFGDLPLTLVPNPLWLEHFTVLFVVINPQPEFDDFPGPWR
ncbi:uncharacterized protein THITE_2087795 [Thermothielavioides terrestris NRRL 8126]|uniref:2EXR domain-containing protein n=1 Tax=Thermothielavioides terrestris (strain ATCC 38088 / NRRL 8126) TaxID=578455 RepID=G2QZ87_THETT|nr:uncharacterized protein THITE_2087795 [Thermothielavioides terrestris NRRL 8126]AEO66323.1 hypothetical protein THITE_2087795 [Thermothielavioides terrestris NRRL 8126]